MTPGDIIYCDFPSFGDKPNRPAIVLSVNETSIYCLRITNKPGTDKYELPTDLMGLIDCCAALTGFIYLKPTSILASMCVVGNCSYCKISSGLKLILKLHGIKF